MKSTRRFLPLLATARLATATHTAPAQMPHVAGGCALYLGTHLGALP